MNDLFDDLPAMRELRQSLQDAANREAVVQPASRPRIWPARRWLVGVAIAVLAAGGAAAATLLSTGKPVAEPVGKSPRYSSGGANGPTLAVNAPDDPGAPHWGVAVYESRSGEQCAIAGQIRGQALGIYAGGQFHSYGAKANGPCDDLSLRTQFHDVRYFAQPNRTLVYGRVSGRVRSVTLTANGDQYRAVVGHGGAFLFLFKGRVSPAGLQLRRNY